VPAPSGDPDLPLQALIFDSSYDTYRGVIANIRVINGTLRKGMRIKMMATDKVYEVTEVGTSSPFPIAVDELTVGDVGFIAASIKSVGDTRVGDTITCAENP